MLAAHFGFRNPLPYVQQALELRVDGALGDALHGARSGSSGGEQHVLMAFHLNAVLGRQTQFARQKMRDFALDEYLRYLHRQPATAFSTALQCEDFALGPNLLLQAIHCQRKVIA